MDQNTGKNISTTLKKILRIIIFLFLFFGLVAAVAIGFIFYGAYQFYVPKGGSETQSFQIEKGEGVKEIAKSLEDERLIRSGFWFETYVWLTNKQNRMQAGRYTIGRNLSIVEIANLISQGKVTADEIWVTIPEGLTLAQIKSKFQDNFLSAGANLDKKTVADFKTEYNFFSGAPENTTLEGYLFPDTYKFEKENTPEEIIGKILDNFDKKLTGQMRADIAKQNRSIFEIITMASILEKEVKTSDDRKIVAGIFWKRIRDKYPMESDATLSYIFGDKEDQHSSEQTKVDSPYNTYKYSGLPPGPINNPGSDAILAAIYPQESDYYFFLTRPDTGQAVFAKTLDEHNLNKVKYLK